MRNIRRRAWGLLAALAVAACNSPPPKSDQPPTASAPPAAAESRDVTLAVVKWPELEKAIASHKGKVVVLDVWADY